jgi:hypothetical protein
MAQIEDSCEFVPFPGVSINELYEQNERLTAAFPGVSVDELIELCEKLTELNEEFSVGNKKDLDIIHDLQKANSEITRQNEELRNDLIDARYDFRTVEKENIQLHLQNEKLRDDCKWYRDTILAFDKANKDFSFHQEELLLQNEKLRDDCEWYSDLIAI